ncbi:hypothetical protein HTZ77_39765 [Nonomuraea sp. SMC257]|uniref:DUF7224 domain-containing protein n=1 Tax=Nonomuraea montanisoli TaxID=2741721 RepID=A0A7Y6IH47_9ACTN|nr:hypothetical protein [Nonomuraea montanisoli]NUW37495.1 hypothetical protein [Nonomuraea montanisoli]
MPLRRWARSSAAALALPVLLAYLFFVMSRSVDALEDNWLSATVLVSSAAVLAAGPVCAAAGAWEGARLARGGVDDAAAVRSRAAILAWSLLPVLGAALVALLGGLALAGVAMAGVAGLPDPLVLAVALLVITAWTLAGFAAGRHLHPLVGVPLLLVGTWLWLACPAALETFWVRHLTGNNLGFCCETHTVYDRRALYAQAVVAVSLAGAAYLAWSRRRGARPAWAGIAGLPLVAVAVAFPLVRDMGPEAQVPRTSGLACGRSDGVEVCVWREREKRLGTAALIAVPAARRLAAGTGLPAPRRVTEGPATGGASWRFAMPPGAKPDDVLFGLATGLLPAEPPVCGPGWSGADAHGPLSAWLALKAGAGQDAVERRTGPRSTGAARRALGLPAAEQVRWFRHNLDALRRCDVSPSEVTLP